MGHLLHIYENRDITLGEIKKILEAAVCGSLECASEKFDGLNIVFTWNINLNELRVARAPRDVKNGGMGAASLSSKFSGRGPLSDAFDFSYETLRAAISLLSDDKKEEIFGRESNFWYSAEIIYAANSNVIKYDRDLIVLHPHLVFFYDGEALSRLFGGENKLLENIDSLGKNVICPESLKFVKHLDEVSLRFFFDSLNQEFFSAGLDDSSTVGDYLLARVTEVVRSKFDLPEETGELLVRRCAGIKGAPTLIQIKKKVNNLEYESIRNFVDSPVVSAKSLLAPIETLIHAFATRLLEGCQSSLVADSLVELNRRRNAVDFAIRQILREGTDAEIKTLAFNMKKLGSLENINSTAEGVVFKYKNHFYKFTGSFAPENQILGTFRYDR